MKVLHLLQSSKFSGAENVVCQIVSMFKDDNDIDMVYCSKDGQIRNTLNERGIEFVPMSKLCIREVNRVLREYKPDIIHAHDFKASVISAMISSKIPVVSHLHNNSPWLKKYGVYSFIFGLSCFRYKKILTVSNSVFDEYVFGNVFRKKLKIIANPINTKDIITRSTAYDYKESFDVCFCGRLSQPKNPLLFVDIIKSIIKNHPNLKAVMIGDGELRQAVENRIDELNLKKNITLLGFVNNPYPLIKNCKVMCMPSAWEGFGLAAVEALSLGTPVICSNAGGLPTIVNNECGHICINKNDYIEQISILLDDRALLSKVSKNARSRIAKFDNIENYKNALNKIYHGCISK